MFDYKIYIFRPIKISSCLPEKSCLETPKNSFDIVAYYDLNDDIKRSFSLFKPDEIYNHYITQGIKEVRNTTYTNELITIKSIIKWHILKKF